MSIGSILSLDGRGAGAKKTKLENKGKRKKKNGRIGGRKKFPEKIKVG